MDRSAQFLIGKVPVAQLPERIGVSKEINPLKEFIAHWELHIG